MNRFFAALFVTLWWNTVWAEDRFVFVTDVPVDTAKQAKSATGNVGLLRHYEGLKHFTRGRQMELQERIPEALQAYQFAMQLDGQAVDLIRHMLPLCAKLQHTASTLRLIRRSLAIDAKQPELWLRYAQELYQLDRHEEVLSISDQALKLVNPQDHPAFAAELSVVRGMSQEARLQYADAVKSYQSALVIVQDHNRFLEDPFSPTMQELPAEEAKLLERLGRACMKAKDTEGALRYLKQSHVMHPRGEDRLELNLAEVYLAAEKPEVAIAHLEKAITHRPLSDEAYRLMVTAYQKSGREAEVLPMLQKLHLSTPQHTAINLVLAERLTQEGNYALAERLYREIFTVEQAPFKDAVTGYYRLLVAQGKQAEALMEFDQLLQQRTRQTWARAAMVALIYDQQLLKNLLSQQASVSIKSSTRLMLIRLCCQAELWNEAETLIQSQLKSETKPQELYLLLAKSLLERKALVELVKACDEAVNHPGIAQPLVFHVEAAKAYARLGNADACNRSLQLARELCNPGTSDDYRLQCTVLYTQHLLKNHTACIKQAQEMLETTLATGPWGRQIRYVLAHALEAERQFDQANQQYEAIVRNDPNDSEAMAAHARCLLLQGKDFSRAESAIRTAIELDLIEQRKRIRLGQQAGKLQPHPDYQATLGATLLRHGKTQEGTSILIGLAQNAVKPNSWIALSLGDAYLTQHKAELARQCWKQALELLPGSGMMGIDLRDSLDARLKQQAGPVVPASATTTSSPAKP